MCDLRDYIHQVAGSDSNVLITGETGTGKELVAQLIHEHSGRRHKPFVCLNSTAVPEPLVESELFGYERGAFTGAHAAQEGKLAAANGGTAFFDEIGDTSPTVQAKLLRAIESRRIYRLGSTRSHDLDIRVLAATNQDLGTAMQEHRFRSDLYYRLNVIRIEIPPLRDRMEDVPGLVDHYIQRFNPTFHKHVSGLYPYAMDLLLSYHWPGNVRELRNVLEALFVNLPREADGMVELPAPVTRLLGRCMQPHATERTMVLRALTATNWNKTEAAKSLQWSRMTLYRKMTRYRISSPTSGLTPF
ncbi:sigma-54 interaction domain-containing protein [Nitrospira sp. Nam80]